ERSVTTRRDGAGRVVETTLADGSKITNDYTDGTRTITTTQTNHGPYVEQVVFDGLGLPGAVIKAGDTVTHEVHDIDGRVLTTTQVGGLRQDFTYDRSEEHTSELQSLRHLVCRLLLE